MGPITLVIDDICGNLIQYTRRNQLTVPDTQRQDPLKITLPSGEPADSGMIPSGSLAVLCRPRVLCVPGSAPGLGPQKK